MSPNLRVPHLLTLLLITVGLTACSGPLGPFSGGALAGEEHTGEVSDWSFVADMETIALETNPTDPHSVNTWIGVIDGKAYIPTSLILGAENPQDREWVQNVQNNSDVRLGFDGKIYAATLVRLSDEQEIKHAKQVLMTKYSEETTEQTDAAWIYRVQSR